MALRGAEQAKIEGYKRRLPQLAQEFRWDIISRPLDDYCLSPKLAADKSHLDHLAELAAQEQNSSEAAELIRRSFPKKLFDLFKNLLIK
jgi:hypothetical protein